MSSRRTSASAAGPPTADAPVDPLFHAISDPALRAAAARVSLEWPEIKGDEDLRQEIVELALAVEDPAAEQDWRSDPVTALATRRRLLDLLRAELVETWRADPASCEPAAMLALLQALEHTRTALETVISPDPAAFMPGPYGLDVIIEIAHDLKSPLTSILFLADTLRLGHSGEVNEVQRRQLGIIYSAALGMVGMAGDLTDLAHRGDRLLGAEPGPFSLAQLFESVAQIVRPMAEAKMLQFRLSPPLPDQRVGQAVALTRILLNLATNALKFTDQGFVEIAGAATGPGRVEFSVSDSGRGLGPRELDTLFQPFRVPPGGHGHFFSGSGLGLAICRRLTRALGAELSVDSDPRRGTRFSFEVELPEVEG